MKRFLIFASLAAATVVFSGCGGGSSGGGGYVPPPAVEWTTLFLIDQEGSSLGGISYTCDSGSGVTAPDGGFTFVPGDACDFYNLDGYYIFDNLGSIEDGAYGVDGIQYECASGSNGYTDAYGSFVYDLGDNCTFYL